MSEEEEEEEEQRLGKMKKFILGDERQGRRPRPAFILNPFLPQRPLRRPGPPTETQSCTFSRAVREKHEL